MTIKQNIMWTRYLLFGISSFLAFLSSCGEPDADAYLHTTWTYINETAHDVSHLPEKYGKDFHVSMAMNSFCLTSDLT